MQFEIVFKEYQIINLFSFLTIKQEETSFILISEKNLFYIENKGGNHTVKLNNVSHCVLMCLIYSRF